MELVFRTLKANEIDCRIATINEKGLTLLLYKDARVDQNILDETVGALNWQRQHTRDNANCIVSIWDKDKNQWISKEDTGTESFTEKEKGLASDSFKRACFNWGIGRELYSAPFIWISADKANIKQGNNGKLQCFDRFEASEVAYDDDRNIIALTIINTRTNNVVYKLGGTAATKKIDTKTIKHIERLVSLTESNTEKLLEYFKVSAISDMTEIQAKLCIEKLNKKGEKTA